MSGKVDTATPTGGISITVRPGIETLPSADSFVTVVRPKTSKNPNSFWLVLKDDVSGMIMLGNGQGGTRFKYVKRVLVKPKSANEKNIESKQRSGQNDQGGQGSYQPRGGYGGGYQRGGGYNRNQGRGY